MPATRGHGVTTAADPGLPVELPDNELASKIFHSLSQPLTVMECGLEMSLRQDKTVAQLRKRMESLLAAAQLLHQRLLELRVLRDASDAGDTAAPVALEGLISQLREDFAPASNSANVKLSVTCKPAFVRGNAARLHNGFFHLFEFLLRNCPSGGSVRVIARRKSPTVLEVKFDSCGPPDAGRSGPVHALDSRDLGLRIAQRTFQAVGGALHFLQKQPSQIAAVVKLPLAN
jgi:signal transduction histidine kinase